MAKRNSIPARIDPDLKIEIEDIAKKNNLSFPQASKIVAKRINQMKKELKNQGKFKMDIQF
jgi:antitoxin component of RelBE/YafQ-DinJ toxin-antitoxin module